MGVSAGEANEQQTLASIYVRCIKAGRGGASLWPRQKLSHTFLFHHCGDEDAQQKTELAGSFSSQGRTANADRLQIRFN